jgi:hypothetical protein
MATSYIKVFEDLFLPPQPYVEDGFANRGRELKPPQYAQTPVPLEFKPLHEDFLPFHKNFNFYRFNQITGYTEPDVPYPIYTTGFRSVGL